MSKKRPVIIIDHRRTRYFPTITCAAHDLRISKQRLLRGLEDPYGEIPGTHPVKYIDDALPLPADYDEDDDDY